MIRNLIRNKTILAVASIIIGVILIVRGRAVVDTTIRVFGYVLLAAAGVYLWTYFGGNNRTEVQLGYAGLSALGGLVLVFFAPAIRNILPTLIGIALILNGIANLTSARFETGFPKLSKAWSIVTIVLGGLAVLHPGAIANVLTVFAGAALVLNGLADLDLIRRFW